MKQLICALLLSAVCSASQLDSKSLFIGIGIGSGLYATRQHTVYPVSKATAKGTKKGVKAVVHVVTFGKK